MLNTDATKARLEAQLAELMRREDRIAQDLAAPLNAARPNRRSRCRTMFRLTVRLP